MEKSNIFDNGEELKCSYCGEDLTKNIDLSMVIIATDIQGNIVSIKPCCKGECDKALVRQLPAGAIDGWEELSDFTNPYLYLKRIIAMFNNIHDGKKFANDEAFEAYKQILICMAPYVMRNLSDAEKGSASLDNMLPF